MIPDYKNWIPKGMIYGLIVGTGALGACFATSLILTKDASAPIRIGLNTALGLGTIACAKAAQWSVFAYNQFSYNGKRKLSKQIIDGIAEYINISDDGTGLDVGCGSGALTLACAKRNPKAKMVGIDY